MIGSLNADTVFHIPSLPAPGETVLATETRQEPGGKASNQAVSAALLGADVALIGVVGADANGEWLLREAGSRGVDTSGVTVDETHHTGTAVVMVDERGENSIVVSAGANAALAPAMIDPDLFAGNAVVALTLESPLAAVTEIARTACVQGCEVLLNASPARNVPTELLASTGVLIVNRGEVEAISGVAGDSDWVRTAAALAELGVDRTIVTLGADGAAVLDTRRGIDVLPAIAVAAMDTTGCGDAFMGAVAAELAFGRPLVEAARTGIRAGAWAATRLGAQSAYGTRQDLDTLRPTC